jgi:malate synthase
MADEKLEDRAKRSSKAASRKAASKKSAKKAGLKKSASKQASRGAKAKNVAGKKVALRKPASDRTARQGKRAVLPPLAPPSVLAKATRSPMRRASRINALLRNKGAVKSSPAAREVGVCTEAALREKLRIAAPYVEIWLSRRASETSALDTLTAEAAFVRIWQWLTLEAVLEDRRTVTADLIDALFADVVRGERL